MQPCSQPLYGLMDRSKSTSGLVLRAMIVRACSGVRVVRRGAASTSSPVQPSSKASTVSGSNRPVEFYRAPRPFAASAMKKG